MASNFREIITPVPPDIWTRVYERDPLSLVFQSPAWVGAICATGRYKDATRMYVTSDRKVLILPMVQSIASDETFSSFLSLPNGWGMGGLISEEPLRFEDIKHVLLDLGTLSGMRIRIRPNPLKAQDWPSGNFGRFASVPRETHILNLAGDFDEVWSTRFPSATRTKIRRSEKAGVEVISGEGGELLPVFYQIYLNWIDRRASERKMPGFVARWIGKYREPRRKYELAAQSLGNRFQVWIAQVDQQPVAAAILLIDQCHAFYWRSASLKDLAGPTRANDYLQYKMIQYACSAGCLYYHMGESGGVESLKQFKSKFGAEAVPYRGFYHEKLPLTRMENWMNSLIHQVEHLMMK